MDSIFQISINGQVHNVGTVVRVNNHYMMGIALGILAALIAGAVLAFVVMKHLRKKKKGGLLSVMLTLYNCYSPWVGIWDDLHKSFNLSSCFKVDD